MKQTSHVYVNEDLREGSQGHTQAQGQAGCFSTAEPVLCIVGRVAAPRSLPSSTKILYTLPLAPGAGWWWGGDAASASLRSGVGAPAGGTQITASPHLEEEHQLEV